MRFTRLVVVALMLPQLAVAQSATMHGKVLTDSTERPIAGVLVSMASWRETKSALCFWKNSDNIINSMVLRAKRASLEKMSPVT